MSVANTEQDVLSTSQAGYEFEVEDEAKLEMASQWQLMWWKFRHHKLAMISAFIIMMFYFVAIFADFFAPNSSGFYIAEYVHAPPQSLHLFQDGRFDPFVYGYSFERDPVSFKKVFEVDRETIIPVGFLVRGEPYALFGIIETDIRLFGPKTPGAPFYLLGGDEIGHDLFSRIIFASRISLSIGLVGVGLSTTIGIILGGISGLLGGTVDNIIQRLIEIINSVPDLPILIAIAAMVPIDWPIVRVYFIITLIISLRAWTGMARVVRSKFLALREEDFVMAARLDGVPRRRLILRHMLPSFYSHIIASLTLAIPGMILAETALSFLGLGLREPAVSWGVLLMEAQSVTVIANHPWLLLPALAVIVVVLAFNFFGDGLRDAADPY
ncbi:MAG: ABC transporter permease [Aggregatilineales bacterium]